MNNFFKSITKSSLKYFQDFINRLSFPVKLIITTILCISIFITLSAFLIIQNIQSNIDHQIEILNYNLKATQTIAQVSAQALLLNYKNNNVRNKKLNELINNAKKENISDLPKEDYFKEKIENLKEGYDSVQRVKEEFCNLIKELNTDEKVPIYSDKVDDKRGWLSFFGWTKKEFYFFGQPFEKDNIIEKPQHGGNLKRIDKNCSYSDGKYHSIYESNFYQDGIASVVIKVEKRLKSDNVISIELAKGQIEILDKKILMLTNGIQRLEMNRSNYKQVITILSAEFHS